MGIFNDLLKEAGNEFASIAEDGVITGDVTGHYDTGSLSLNALLSGSIFAGLPNNRIIALAGEPSTGKTFYAINIVSKFLQDNPTGFVFYFESEAAISKQMLMERKIPTDRMAIVPVATVQEFRTQAMKILNGYMEAKEKDRPPMMFVLDSLGNLSTTKEIEDITDGKETRDMTRAQLIRGAFRTLTLKLGKARVPMIITNHVYDVVGAYVPIKKMNGGGGLEYAASEIIFLNKSKVRDEKTKETTGVVIKATLKKSRISIENRSVETLLDYSKGLDKYYGLTELCLKFGIFNKAAKKIELPDGTSVFESAINKNPEKYFTQEILDVLDVECANYFTYGKDAVNETEEELVDAND